MKTFNHTIFLVIILGLNLLTSSLDAQYVKWQYNTPDQTEFYSSPALAQVSGEWLLFIGGVDGYFYAINTANGTIKWRKRSIYAPGSYPPDPEDVFYASPAINHTLGHIYCGGESGELYCYKTSPGIMWQWRFPNYSYDYLTYNEVSTSVAISGNRIYAGMNCGYSTDYRLYVLKDTLDQCDTVWSFRTGCKIISSPAIDDSGNIYFGDDSGYVTCLNQNGIAIWRRRISSGIYKVYASPTICNNTIFIGTDNGFLYSLNSYNGSQIWQYPSTGAGLERVRSSPVVGNDGAIYFGCDDGELYSLNPAGMLIPGFPVQLSDGPITSTPAIAVDGTIIVYTEEDIAYGIGPNGAILWQVDLHGDTEKAHKTTLRKSRLDDIQPSPLIGPDGTIYVASVQGGVYAIGGLSFVVPSGNECWVSGSVQSIKWLNFNVGGLANTPWPKFRHNIRNTGNYSDSIAPSNIQAKYRLLLSINNGLSFPDTITHNVPISETTYQWTLPSLSSSYCRIMCQILTPDDSVISYTISRTFAIQIAPIVNLLQNPSFEIWNNLYSPAGWGSEDTHYFCVSKESIQVFDGLYAAKLKRLYAGSGNNRGIFQRTPVSTRGYYSARARFFDNTDSIVGGITAVWRRPDLSYISSWTTVYTVDSPDWQVVQKLDTVPLDAAFADFQIRTYGTMQQPSGGTFVVDSAFFGSTEPLIATINILTPNGNEFWAGASNQLIRWRTIGTGFANQRLLLSRDDGLTYIDTIANNIAPIETTYNWTVPLINSSDCRLMVQIVDVNGSVIVQDVSDESFTIDSYRPSTPFLRTPSNNAIIQDSIVIFTWLPSSDNLSGIRGYRIQIANNADFINTIDTIVPSTRLVRWLSDTTYYWRVKAIDRANNESDWSSIRSFIVSIVGITEVKLNNLPFITMLYTIKPNPMSKNITRISFSLAEPQKISLNIYDASGRLVKTLVDEFKSSGVYNVAWNCRDDYGRKVSEGIYFYTLEIPKLRLTKKLLLAR